MENKVNILNYKCECSNCQIANTIIDIKGLDRIEIHKKNVEQRVCKNKLYECETRTKAIVDEIIKLVETVSKDVIIIVPNDQHTIKKIISRLVDTSDDIIQIKKGTKFVLELKDSDNCIYLIFPHLIMECCPTNPSKVGTIFLNCFYSHMYVDFYDKEFKRLFQLFSSCKLVLVDNNSYTYLNEKIRINNWINKMIKN